VRHVLAFARRTTGVTQRRAAFLHCHNCDWSQDDFWSPGGYNPVRYICEQRAADWENDLFEDRVGMERDALEEMGIPADQIHGEAGEAYAYGPTVVAAELRSLANSIDHMKWRTEDEWKRDMDNATCPQCGTSFEPDID
jgi:hypothetical protein